MVAGVVSFAGWALGMWFGMGLGSVIWVFASVVMSRGACGSALHCAFAG
jgi:hypothetical protein